MFGRKKTPADPLPVYMDAIEFSQLLAIVESLGPRRVLEWGSGGSTRALLAACPFIERYVSVEHDAAWIEEVVQHVSDDRLELELVAPDKPLPPGKHTREQIIAWDAAAEVDPYVMERYVGYPRTLGTEFDFVLVDGRARCLCVAEGYGLLAPGGVLVLHDAQREQYHEALHAQGRAVFLKPWVSGQIALVRKPRP